MAETPPPDARWLRHALIRSQQDLNGARERSARYANEALAWQQRAAACGVERATQRERIRELELALRDARRFANAVTQWETPNRAQHMDAYHAQAEADKALGYCGCPTCSAARDAEGAAKEEDDG